MKKKRKLEFRNEQIIRYMGNKRNILNHIVKNIIKVHDKESALCDLMAGTNSVAYAIKTLGDSNIQVISNDVQSYSYVIAKALIENNQISSISKEKVKKDLFNNFRKNLDIINSKWTNKYILSNQYKTGKTDNILKKISKNNLYTLFTFYFSNIYFSLKQCKEIDSLRYAIDQIKDPLIRSIYLTCLLYAVSYGSSSFGHFAQPRKFSSEVKLIRKKSIWKLFLKKINSLSISFNESNNYCFNYDCKELLVNTKFLKLSKRIGTIYLDPPYSPANYSRFYHLLETLIVYDFPKNEYKGLYRDKRFLSGFCKISTVEQEFRNIIQFSWNIKSNLVISYSNTGLLTKSRIKKICREYYPKKSVWSEEDIPHLHSTQGNRKKNGVKEILIICKY